MTFTPIPENSGATPGLFNTRFAEMDATISAATTSLLNTISTATGVVSSAVSTSYLQASAVSLGPSTVTITGRLALANGTALAPALEFASEVSLGIYRSGASSLAQSYGTIRLLEVWVASGISLGNAAGGGSLIPAMSSMSSKVAAFVVQPSASSFTRVVWAAVQPGDQILTTVQPDAAVSSLSSGLLAHSHCTQAGQFEFRLSNVSTLVQNQSSKTWYFTRISPF